jgi:hypothetical protein
MMSRMICTYDLDPIPNAATTSATRVALFVWPSDHETKLRTRTLAELRMDALCANHLCRACPHSSTHGWKNTGAVPQLCPRPAARHEGADPIAPLLCRPPPPVTPAHAPSPLAKPAVEAAVHFGYDLQSYSKRTSTTSSPPPPATYLQWSRQTIAGWWVGDCIPAGD